MPDLTREQIFEYYRRLPEDLKEAITGVESANAIYEIGRKYGLNVRLSGELAREVGEILLGISHPKDFVTNLQKSLEVDRKTASEIARDINMRIFKPVHENLKKLHGIITDRIEFGAPEVPAAAPVQPPPLVAKPPFPPPPRVEPPYVAPPPPRPSTQPPPPPPPQPLPPIVQSFYVQPSTIERGKAAVLKWSTENATEIWIDPDVGMVEKSGSRTVTPNHTMKFILTAKGPGGSVSKSTTINVTVPQPTPPPPPAPPTPPAPKPAVPMPPPAPQPPKAQPPPPKPIIPPQPTPPPPPVKPRIEAEIRPEIQPPKPAQPVPPVRTPQTSQAGPQPLRIKPDTTAFGDISKGEEDIGGARLKFAPSPVKPVSTQPPGPPRYAPQPPTGLPVAEEGDVAEKIELREPPKIEPKREPPSAEQDYGDQDPYREPVDQ